jgi:hypothetical protein
MEAEQPSLGCNTFLDIRHARLQIRDSHVISKWWLVTGSNDDWSTQESAGAINIMLDLGNEQLALSRMFTTHSSHMCVYVSSLRLPT